MVLVDVQVVIPFLDTISHLSDLLGQLPLDWFVLAQTVDDPDVLGQMQSWFSNFIQSGQVWALLIGLIIGYLFRGMTSF
ncbi:MAG TPA: hypothetical protein DCY91_06235 [Cyanobacteria bacterium UBA11370]|nr:hypothetical protein [Cyanobacteria bacterium UBA11370]HBY78293.1 hypothetical protein [Cyanobacteria bacterium UBA11148]